MPERRTRDVRCCLCFEFGGWAVGERSGHPPALLHHQLCSHGRPSPSVSMTTLSPCHPTPSVSPSPHCPHGHPTPSIFSPRVSMTTLSPQPPHSQRPQSTPFILAPQAPWPPQCSISLGSHTSHTHNVRSHWDSSPPTSSPLFTPRFSNACQPHAEPSSWIPLSSLQCLWAWGALRGTMLILCHLWDKLACLWSSEELTVECLLVLIGDWCLLHPGCHPQDP